MPALVVVTPPVVAYAAPPVAVLPAPAPAALAPGLAGSTCHAGPAPGDGHAPVGSSCSRPGFGAPFYGVVR